MKIMRLCAVLFLLLLLLYAILPTKKKDGGPSGIPFSSASCYGKTSCGEKVLSVDDGEQALLFRLMLIRGAKRELCCSTFDFRADRSGTDLIAAFYDAADRGVRVRILIDGLNGWLRLFFSREIRALAVHPNAEIREYNPMRLFRLRKVQFRMHDKYLIADETAYLLGGRNTNDLFLGRETPGQNIDRELLVREERPGKNSSLRQLRRYFDSVWGMSVCKRAYSCLRVPPSVGEDLRRKNRDLRTLYPGLSRTKLRDLDFLNANRVTLLANPAGARRKEPVLWNILLALMSGGQDPVAVTPYLICSRDMYRELGAAREKAGSLKILTNSEQSGANVVGSADYLLHRRKLQETGAQIYEFSGPHSTHTKTVLPDGRLSLVGSFNFDIRSVCLDTELMLAVDSAALNTQLRADAELRMRQSEKQAAGETPGRTRAEARRHAALAVLGVLQEPVRRLL